MEACQWVARLGRSGHFMYVWGHLLNWTELAIVWLFAFAIGIAVYFVPIARLLDGLVDKASRSTPNARSSSVTLCSLVRDRRGRLWLRSSDSFGKPLSVQGRSRT